MPKQCQRCEWATKDPLNLAYHDQEWGVPIYQDDKLFEFILLEGMQAGLSWITILKKRDNYRESLDGFSAEKMANYNERKIAQLMNNPGIIRNRLKINSLVTNAKTYLALKEKNGSFADFLWGYVDNEPIQNKWRTHSQIPAATPLSTEISVALKQRGFKFIGPTIIYAFMQAVGMVNDHIISCYRHAEIKRL